MPPRKVREYSLHVRRGGAEVLYRKLPEVLPRSSWQGIRLGPGRFLPAHHIIVLELEDGSLVEETTIACFQTLGVPPAMLSIICPRPHGAGWKLHDGESDKRAVWRRPLPSGERPMFDQPDHE